MGSGIIILSIIALLFLGMYFYSYVTTKNTIIKENRERQRKLLESEERELQLKIKKQERLNLREENLSLAETRSDVIKKEIVRLEKIKRKQNS